MIAIIDYDAGNVKSVQKALAYLHEDTILTRDPKQLLAAEKVILPGVGAFGDAMGKLKEYGLIDVISEIVDKNTPFLGICLGLQLLFESSEESPGVEGLGLLKGKSCGFQTALQKTKDRLKFRISAGIPSPFRKKDGCLKDFPGSHMCISCIPII